MFQYAFGRSEAARLRTELYLDISALGQSDYQPGLTSRPYELGVFNIRAKIATRKNLRALAVYPAGRIDSYRSRVWLATGLSQHIYERKFCFDERILSLIRHNSFLAGFWQSEKYFRNIKDEIRRELAPPRPADYRNNHYESLIQVKNAVSVHIRRGDYVGNTTHPLCSPVYYREAIKTMREHLSNPVFFFFSDEPGWAGLNLSPVGEYYIVSGNESNNIADLYLMSQCNHHIIANSSFSWWGAWLNDSGTKKVIAPANWFSNPLTETQDLLPEGWVTI